MTDSEVLSLQRTSVQCYLQVKRHMVFSFYRCAFIPFDRSFGSWFDWKSFVQQLSVTVKITTMRFSFDYGTFYFSITQSSQVFRFFFFYSEIKRKFAITVWRLLALTSRAECVARTVVEFYPIVALPMCVLIDAQNKNNSTMSASRAPTLNANYRWTEKGKLCFSLSNTLSSGGCRRSNCVQTHFALVNRLVVSFREVWSSLGKRERMEKRSDVNSIHYTYLCRCTRS